MARITKTHGRCPDCGYALRAKGHELGAHHNGGLVGEKVMARKRHLNLSPTKPKSGDHGFDFRERGPAADRRIYDYDPTKRRGRK